MSWLREHVDLPPEVTSRDVADRLTAAGLQVEHVTAIGRDITGVVVARVIAVEELTGYNKPVRWVTVDDDTGIRQVICGATNFAAGDLVAYARPPATLPDGVAITARRTYDHVSDGMLCSGRELGLTDDHSGILTLETGLPLGADVVEVLGLADDVLDLSLNPDRGYALSIRGVAREVATAYSLPFRDPAVIDVPIPDGTGHPVRLVDSGCDRYVAACITDIDPAARSPIWLQRRLVLAGMRPISLVVDVTNHVMLELGQPLHAFDRDRLTGDIVVRRAAAGERLRTLDGVDRALDAGDLVIADDTGPIALAGVMGGESTEIRDETRTIVLESAHFDPVCVALTARRHRLASEASRRFERGVDHALAPSAAAVAGTMLQRLAGASAGGVTDVDERPSPVTIRCDPALPGRIAGLDYPSAVVEQRLVDVGCSVVGAADGQLDVTPPSWRPDLRRDVDLVEEVVRLEGYDRLPSTLPTAPGGRGLTRSQRLRRQLARTLAGDGYVEVLGSPFVDADVVPRLRLDTDDPRVPSVRLANPVSEAEPYLRASLLPGLFATVVRNVSRGLSDVALFEIGPVFRPSGDAVGAPRPAAGVRPSDADLAAIDAALPEQPQRIGLILSGERERSGWWGGGRPAEWGDAVESVRGLAAAVGLEVVVAADQHAPFHPGRCAALYVGDRLLGHAGELDPRVVAACDLPPRACAAEISLDVLVAAAPDVATAPRLSTYPVATVDVALVVTADVPAAAVESALRDGVGELLESLRLFDVYTGPQVGDGYKSLAYTLRLRAPDRTLTTDEVTAVRDAAVGEANRRTGAVLRT